MADTIKLDSGWIEVGPLDTPIRVTVEGTAVNHDLLTWVFSRTLCNLAGLDTPVDTKTDDA